MARRREERDDKLAEICERMEDMKSCKDALARACERYNALEREEEVLRSDILECETYGDRCHRDLALRRVERDEQLSKICEWLRPQAWQASSRRGM